MRHLDDLGAEISGPISVRHLAGLSDILLVVLAVIPCYVSEENVALRSKFSKAGHNHQDYQEQRDHCADHVKAKNNDRNPECGTTGAISLVDCLYALEVLCHKSEQ